MAIIRDLNSAEIAMTDQSPFWWSIPVEVWDTWGLRLMIVGAVLGLLALVASLASSFILYKTGNVFQARVVTETAEANARAAEAQLALEKFKAPKSLSGDQILTIAEKMSAWAKLPKSDERQSAAVFSVTDSFEANALADQIAAALGPDGAEWRINRYPVMYGKSYSVSGVAMLISNSPRGATVAQALIEALRAEEIDADFASERRAGCQTAEEDDTKPWCSSISVMVGGKPRK